MATPPERPDFSAAPSRRKAPLWLQLVMFLLMAALAIAAIWWIDRGAMLTNTHP